MSFAQRISHPLRDLPYVNLLIPPVKLYDSYGHNDADMADHISSIRFKTDPSFY